MDFCLQRYIATRPMFLDASDLRLGDTTPFQSNALATRDLQALYRDILASVKHEAQVVGYGSVSIHCLKYFWPIVCVLGMR